jgi:biopolymer transport protein ExbB
VNAKIVAILTAALLGAGVLVPGALAEEGSASFDRAATSAEEDLQKALRALSELRERIAAEKLPLNRELRRLENRLSELRGEYQEAGRSLDGRHLQMTNLQAEIEGRKDETAFLSNQLDEYVRNFETRVHISELQRYRELVENAREASNDESLSAAELYAVQAELVEASLDRLTALVGGETFEGQAVGEGGRLEEVRFALIGPVALYATLDGASGGLAEQQLGSLEPRMMSLDDPALGEGVEEILASGQGLMPFDPSLGNARKIEATQETLQEHIAKGGPVMVPILVMAAAALIVALWRWMVIARVRQPSEKKIDALLEAVRSKDFKAAEEQAASLNGPTGEMLQAGVKHVHEPRELVEEVMYERMLETKLRLQAYLPFVALASAAAPLMGLLGTVTGMINTFKLITVFGSGDAKTLSSGISEALVTTEFGLIVAIPSLLLYAFLSRKARRLVDGMEKTAVSLLNRISTTPAPAPVQAPDEVAKAS